MTTPTETLTPKKSHPLTPRVAATFAALILLISALVILTDTFSVRNRNIAPIQTAK